MKTLLAIGLILLASISMGCSGGGGSPSSAVPGQTTPPISAAPKPGQFSLVSMNTPSSNNALTAKVYPAVSQSASQSTNFVEIDVGDLRSTQSYFFLLKNVGETDITDIVLSSSNAYVQIVPSRIDRLPPDAQNNFSPIIKVTLEHGIRNNGVGLAATIPMGATTAKIFVTGTTTASGAVTLADPLDVGIKFVSRIANYVLFELGNNTVIPWESCIFYSSITNDGLSIVCYKKENTTVSQLSSTQAILTHWGIKNIGNVDLRFQETELSEDHIIPSNSTFSLPMHYIGWPNPNMFGSRWTIDSQGAIFSASLNREDITKRQYLEVSVTESLSEEKLRINQ